MAAAAAAVMMGAQVGGQMMAARETSKASKHATNMQMHAADIARQEMSPYKFAGNAALNQLYGLSGIDSGFTTGPGALGARELTGMTPEQLRAKSMEAFYVSPEYTVQQGAAQQAFDRLGLSRGDYASGNSALGSAEIAGRTFGDWRNNLASLGSLGPQGAGISANLTTAQGSLAAQNAMNQGQIKADMFGALGGAISQGAGQYSQYQQYQKALEGQQMQANYGGVPPAVAPAPSSLDQLYQGGYTDSMGSGMRVG